MNDNGVYYYNSLQGLEKEVNLINLSSINTNLSVIILPPKSSFKT